VSAVALLRDLSNRGVILEARGPNLLVDGPADVLGADLVDALRVLKIELLQLLNSQEAGREWDAPDWQVYFHERAAIREHDGRLSRREAEHLAFDDTVTHWLCLHPAAASNVSAGCDQCRGAEEPGNSLLPVLAPGGHVWVHDRCWSAWQDHRRAAAEAALQQLGVG
jgi:hypothetical protein